MSIVFRREAVGRGDGSSSTITATYSSNNAGDLLWLGVGWEDSAVTDVSTVVDGALNTWQSAVAKLRNAAIPYAARIFYVPTGCLTSAGNTVTITFGAASTFRRIAALEYRSTNGVWTSNMLGSVATGGTGNSKNLASGNVTPASNDQLVASFAGITGSGNIGATSPYIARATATDGSVGATERILVGGAGVAVNGQATSLSAFDWLIQTVTFNDVGGSVAAPVAAPAHSHVTNVSSSGKARILLAGGR